MKVSDAKGDERNLTPRRNSHRINIFSVVLIRNGPTVVPVLREMHIGIAVFWVVTQCYGTYVTRFRRNLLPPSSGKKGQYLQLI
jgi:hypothetical protein